MFFQSRRHASLVLLVSAAALATSLGGCSWVSFLFKSQPIDPAEVVGTWEADYSQQEDIRDYCDAVGLETLILRSDGTYKQVYHDEVDYDYAGPWNAWHLDERERGSIVRLEHGRLYLLGIENAERLANGQLFIHLDDDGRSYPLELDGSEVILHVLRDPQSPGSLVLEYPPVCDPDGFARLIFRRVSEPEPATGSAP